MSKPKLLIGRISRSRHSLLATMLFIVAMKCQPAFSSSTTSEPSTSKIQETGTSVDSRSTSESTFNMTAEYTQPVDPSITIVKTQKTTGPTSTADKPSATTEFRATKTNEQTTIGTVASTTQVEPSTKSYQSVPSTDMPTSSATENINSTTTETTRTTTVSVADTTVNVPFSTREETTRSETLTSTAYLVDLTSEETGSLSSRTSALLTQTFEPPTSNASITASSSKTITPSGSHSEIIRTAEQSDISIVTATTTAAPMNRTAGQASTSVAPVVSTSRPNNITTESAVTASASTPSTTNTVQAASGTTHELATSTNEQTITTAEEVTTTNAETTINGGTTITSVQSTASTNPGEPSNSTVSSTTFQSPTAFQSMPTVTAEEITFTRQSSNTTVMATATDEQFPITSAYATTKENAILRSETGRTSLSTWPTATPTSVISTADNESTSTLEALITTLELTYTTAEPSNTASFSSAPTGSLTTITAESFATTFQPSISATPPTTTTADLTSPTAVQKLTTAGSAVTIADTTRMQTEQSTNPGETNITKDVPFTTSGVPSIIETSSVPTTITFDISTSTESTATASEEVSSIGGLTTLSDAQSTQVINTGDQSTVTETTSLAASISRTIVAGSSTTQTTTATPSDLTHKTASLPQITTAHTAPTTMEAVLAMSTTETYSPTTDSNRATESLPTIIAATSTKVQSNHTEVKSSSDTIATQSTTNVASNSNEPIYSTNEQFMTSVILATRTAASTGTEDYLSSSAAELTVEPTEVTTMPVSTTLTATAVPTNSGTQSSGSTLVSTTLTADESFATETTTMRTTTVLSNSTVEVPVTTSHSAIVTENPTSVQTSAIDSQTVATVINSKTQEISTANGQSTETAFTSTASAVPSKMLSTQTSTLGLQTRSTSEQSTTAGVPVTSERGSTAALSSKGNEIPNTTTTKLSSHTEPLNTATETPSTTVGSLTTSELPGTTEIPFSTTLGPTILSSSSSTNLELSSTTLAPVVTTTKQHYVTTEPTYSSSGPNTTSRPHTPTAELALSTMEQITSSEPPTSDKMPSTNVVTTPTTETPAVTTELADSSSGLITKTGLPTATTELSITTVEVIKTTEPPTTTSELLSTSRSIRPTTTEHPATTNETSYSSSGQLTTGGKTVELPFTTMELMTTTGPGTTQAELPSTAVATVQTSTEVPYTTTEPISSTSGLMTTTKLPTSSEETPFSTLETTNPTAQPSIETTEEHHTTSGTLTTTQSPATTKEPPLTTDLTSTLEPYTTHSKSHLTTVVTFPSTDEPFTTAKLPSTAEVPISSTVSLTTSERVLTTTLPASTTTQEVTTGKIGTTPEPSPCDSNPCYNNGECLNISMTNFTCNCPAGYAPPLCYNYGTGNSYLTGPPSSETNEGNTFSFNCTFQTNCTGTFCVMEIDWYLANNMVIFLNTETVITESSRQSPDGSGGSYLISTMMFRNSPASLSGQIVCIGKVLGIEYPSNALDVTIFPLPFAVISPRSSSVTENTPHATFTCTGQQLQGSTVIINQNITLSWNVDGVEQTTDGRNPSNITVNVPANGDETIVICTPHINGISGTPETGSLLVIPTNPEPGKYCLSETDKYGLFWPTTPQNSIAYNNCPSQQIPVTGTSGSSRECNNGGNWGQADVTNCISTAYAPSLEAANDVTYGVGANDTEYVAGVLDSLVNLTDVANDSTDSLPPGNIKQSAQAMSDIAYTRNSIMYAIISSSEVQSVVSLTSNLLASANQDSWMDINENEAKSVNTTLNQLLETVDVYGTMRVTQLESNQTENNVDQNLAMQLNAIPFQDDPATVRLPKPFSSHPDDPDTDWIQDSISLNKDTIKSIESNLNDANSIGISCTFYKTVNIIMANQSDFSKHSTVNSRVLSLSFAGIPADFVYSPPIDLNMKMSNTSFDNSTNEPVCSFWNLTMSEWSSEGCERTDVDGSMVSCACNHTTNFGVLVVPLIPFFYPLALNFLSYVLLSLSIVCVLLTLGVYIFYWKHLKSHESTLLVNLCAALLVTYVLFLSGISAVKLRGLCATIAAIMQYIFLVALLLILAEGIQVYIFVAHVFHVRTRRETVWFLAGAWLIPAVIVMLEAAATLGQGFGSSYSCWLSDILRYIFVGIVSAVALINIILAIISIHKAYSGGLVTEKRKSKVKSSIWNICVLSPLTGVSWILGSFAAADVPSASVLLYLFTILTACQGIFIFVFHVVLSKKVKNAIRGRVVQGTRYSTDSTPGKGRFYSESLSVMPNIPVFPENMYGTTSVYCESNNQPDDQFSTFIPDSGETTIVDPEPLHAQENKQRKSATTESELTENSIKGTGPTSTDQPDVRDFREYDGEHSPSSQRFITKRDESPARGIYYYDGHKSGERDRETREYDKTPSLTPEALQMVYMERGALQDRQHQSDDMSPGLQRASESPDHYEPNGSRPQSASENWSSFERYSANPNQNGSDKQSLSSYVDSIIPSRQNEEVYFRKPEHPKADYDQNGVVQSVDPAYRPSPISDNLLNIPFRRKPIPSFDPPSLESPPKSHNDEKMRVATMFIDDDDMTETSNQNFPMKTILNPPEAMQKIGMDNAIHFSDDDDDTVTGMFSDGTASISRVSLSIPGFATESVDEDGRRVYPYPRLPSESSASVSTGRDT